MYNQGYMNVLWLRPSNRWDGEHVSSRRERIAEHLQDMGVEVNLMDTSGLDALPVMKEAITGDYDIIVGTVRVGVPIGYFLSKVLTKPFIASVSDLLESQDYLSTPIYKLMCFIEWQTLKRADAVFFAHPKSYEDALERGIDGTVVRNSVNYEMFADPSNELLKETQDILRDSGIDTQKNIAIYIGNMIKNGHFDEIVKASEQTPGWEFVFVGTDGGANISELVDAVENAYFLGEYDHELMPGFLHHASAAFCLVDNEVPLKITEYGAAGLPTLGYPGKLKKVFSEDELIYVEPNPDEISEALRRISTDEDYARKYAENLRDYASENRWEDIAKKYYESMVKLTE
jgi:glycosyltransferase involved in cell wall biosynthesis